MELDNQYKQDSIFVATPSMRSAKRVASLLGIGAKNIHKRVSERGPASVQVTSRHLPLAAAWSKMATDNPVISKGPAWEMARPQYSARGILFEGSGAMSEAILPRLIRLRDAPRYLGMDPNRFNAEVRPYLTEMPIGKQGVAFDKIDLDAWAEQYKSRNGRPGKAMKGGPPWDAKEHRGSSKGAKSGTSRNKLEKEEFEKALERVTSRKPNDT